jgi:hypothetical protein
MLKYSTILVVASLLLACNSESENNALDSSCNENKPSNYSGGYEISLANELITPEDEFIIQFKAPKHIKINQAKLEGLNMYMGSIPLLFEYKNGNWQSKAMVGACAEPIMQWQLSLDFIDQTSPEHKKPISLIYNLTSQY